MKYINKQLANSVLSSPIRESRQLVKKLCDYDLLAVMQVEHRHPTYAALLAEAKRRGLIKHAQRSIAAPQHSGQISLAF